MIIRSGFDYKKNKKIGSILVNFDVIKIDMIWETINIYSHCEEVGEINIPIADIIVIQCYTRQEFDFFVMNEGFPKEKVILVA